MHIPHKNAGMAGIKAGADILVSGSSVFKASDPKDMIARMHGAEN